MQHISNTTEVHSTWKTIDEKKERKSRPAMDIFVMAIGHLKDTFITDFNKMHNRCVQLHPLSAGHIRVMVVMGATKGQKYRISQIYRFY